MRLHVMFNQPGSSRSDVAFQCLKPRSYMIIGIPRIHQPRRFNNDDPPKSFICHALCAGIQLPAQEFADLQNSFVLTSYPAPVFADTESLYWFADSREVAAWWIVSRPFAILAKRPEEVRRNVDLAFVRDRRSDCWMIIDRSDLWQTVNFLMPVLYQRRCREKVM